MGNCLSSPQEESGKNAGLLSMQPEQKHSVLESEYPSKLENQFYNNISLYLFKMGTRLLLSKVLIYGKMESGQIGLFSIITIKKKIFSKVIDAFISLNHSLYRENRYYLPKYVDYLNGNATNEQLYDAIKTMYEKDETLLKMIVHVLKTEPQRLLYEN